MEDGTIKEGYLKDFNDENLVSFYPQKVAESFGQMEDNNGLANEFYYFIADENSKEEKIALTTIEKIEFDKESDDSEDYKFTLEKVKIASINNELQMVNNGKFVLLPVYYSNSKLKIYSLLVNLGSSSFPYFYMKTQKDDYAVRVFKISMGDVFNLKKMGPKLYESLAYFGKDCEAFTEKLAAKKDFYYNDFVDYAKEKLNNKIFQEKWAVYDKDIKAAKKNMNKDEFKKYKSKKLKEYQDDKSRYFYDTMLNERVEDYINSCE